MTRMLSVASVSVFSAIIAHPAVAQFSPPSPAQQSAPTFVGRGDKPFQGIFRGPAPQPQVTAKLQLPRTVVCGMTVFQVDPKLDARILMQSKPGHTAVPKARIIEPKICR